MEVNVMMVSFVGKITKTSQGQTPSGYASDSAEIPNNDFDAMPLDDDLPF